MKTTTLYDFTLAAGGSQIILADANMYKVLTSTGDISVTRDGGATIKPLRAGRGEKNVEFQRLTLRDLSGAPNSGTILVGDSDFIDDTIVLSSAINVRPEAASTTFQSVTNFAVGSNQIFAPGANTTGVILQIAQEYAYSGTGIQLNLLSKNGTPTGTLDGEAIAIPTYPGGGFANMTIINPVLLPAGQGLYVWATAVSTSRQCAYRWQTL